MSLRLDLLRHGETELGGGLRGSLDDALTDLGWQQMRSAVIDGGPGTGLSARRCSAAHCFPKNWRNVCHCRYTWRRVCKSCISATGKATALRN